MNRDSLITNCNPQFTVFTATYNRGHTLRLVYDSLLSQTMQDFEWLIVDDGSSDDTEKRVRIMIAEGRLRIHYIKKPNGGVHTAHNAAIRKANGRFFLRLDSDDACVPNALETLLDRWAQIPEALRVQFSGVSYLCMQPSGKVIGDYYPVNGWSSDYSRLDAMQGEKWGFHRLEILREYPFPEFNGEKFCPEGLVWARLHEKYMTRCTNVALRIYYSSNDSITTTMTRTRYKSPKGTTLYYGEQMCRLTGRRAFRHAINYIRFSLADCGLIDAWLRSPRRLLVAAAVPFGMLLFARDSLRGDLR